MKARRSVTLLEQTWRLVTKLTHVDATQGGFLRGMARCIGLGVVAALFFVSASLSAQTSTPKKIKLLTLLGRPLQFVIADKQGYFAKHGVSAETENLPSSDILRSNLANGNGDLAYLAVDNAVAMVELAHQDMAILMGGEGSQKEFRVRRELGALKGAGGNIVRGG